jgi:Domain of unknown function (DUF1842)
MSNAIDALPAGLFQLNLRSVVPPDAPPGTPILILTLSVDSPNNTVAGHAAVTFRESPGVTAVMYQSHVTGTLTYVLPTPLSGNPPFSLAVIDLTGYPVINWPPRGGVGPVQLPNLKANIAMDKRLTEGSVTYEYQADQWRRIEQQIVKV